MLLLKTSNVKEQDFQPSQIGTSSASWVRVGIVGLAMQLVGNHTHFCAIQLQECTHNSTLLVSDCYIVTCTILIIPEFHSNVCTCLV